MACGLVVRFVLCFDLFGFVWLVVADGMVFGFACVSGFGYLVLGGFAGMIVSVLGWVVVWICLVVCGLRLWVYVQVMLGLG